MSEGRLVMLTVCWLIGFFVLWRIPLCARAPRRSASTPVPSDTSVIIPARNESHRISPLLRSLQTQTRPAHQVLVVDDDSTDGTAEIARALGASVIKGQPLPEGWRGKTWACWQGAEAATGSRLLFLDADITLAPDALARLEATHVVPHTLVTVQPFHQVCALYEQLSAFFNIILMAGLNSFTPLGRHLPPAGAFGPCLLCHTEDYWQIDGHRAVKNQILEDLALGRYAQEQGLAVEAYGGRGVVDFRMYPGGISELVEGWSKGFGAGAVSTRLPILLLIIAWVAGCCSAAITLWRVLAMADNGTILPAALIYLTYAMQLLWMFRRVGSFHWATALLFPIPLLFFVLIMVRSVVGAFVLRRVTWKGRTIHTGSSGGAP